MCMFHKTTLADDIFQVTGQGKDISDDCWSAVFIKDLGILGDRCKCIGKYVQYCRL